MHQVKAKKDPSKLQQPVQVSALQCLATSSAAAVFLKKTGSFTGFVARLRSAHGALRTTEVSSGVMSWLTYSDGHLGQGVLKCHRPHTQAQLLLTCLLLPQCLYRSQG